MPTSSSVGRVRLQRRTQPTEGDDYLELMGLQTFAADAKGNSTRSNIQCRHCC